MFLKMYFDEWNEQKNLKRKKINILSKNGVFQKTENVFMPREIQKKKPVRPKIVSRGFFHGGLDFFTLVSTCPLPSPPRSKNNRLLYTDHTLYSVAAVVASYTRTAPPTVCRRQPAVASPALLFSRPNVASTVTKRDARPPSCVNRWHPIVTTFIVRVRPVLIRCVYLFSSSCPRQNLKTSSAARSLEQK